VRAVLEKIRTYFRKNPKYFALPDGNLARLRSQGQPDPELGIAQRILAEKMGNWGEFKIILTKLQRFAKN
jgi:hypothetical protein